MTQSENSVLHLVEYSQPGARNYNLRNLLNQKNLLLYLTYNFNILMAYGDQILK